MARLRFIFTIFTFTVLLILAVYVRNRCDRMCHLVNSTSVQERRLRQQLWQKQLQLESLTNPGAVSKSLSPKQD